MQKQLHNALTGHFVLIGRAASQHLIKNALSLNVSTTQGKAAIIKNHQLKP